LGDVDRGKGRAEEGLKPEQREDGGAGDPHDLARPDPRAGELAGVDQRADLSDSDAQDVRRLA